MPYVAKDRIYIGNALAYVKGDEVPDAVVRKYDLKEKVSGHASHRAPKAEQPEPDRTRKGTRTETGEVGGKAEREEDTQPNTDE